MRTYPSLRANTIRDIADVIQFITRERDKDVRDWNNLTQTYIAGRKVEKIPTSSADVAAGDRINDFNWDASYLYLLINNAGTGEWRRVALGAF